MPAALKAWFINAIKSKECTLLQNQLMRFLKTGIP